MALNFNYDNKVMTTISTAADLIVLGLFWAITSIPIFTIGASTAALYYTINKSIRNRKGYAYREYWKAFRNNFKQGTLCFLIWFIIAAFLVGDVVIMRAALKADSPLGVMYFFFLVLCAAALAWGFYLFAYVARFECSVPEALKKTLIIMVANIGYSALLVVIFVALFLLCRDIMSLFIALPGVFGYIKNLILERVFKKYRTPEDIAKELEMNRTFSNQ